MIIHYKNKQLEIGKKTLIMGILNITPDSFSDGGDYIDTDTAIKKALQMIKDGADIIDVGGMSTRPGHKEISIDTEISRVIPIIKILSKKTNILISADTYRWQVAKKALENGASIINDIWGLQYDNGEMAKIISESGAILIAMHNQNTTEYSKDIIESIKIFFNKTFEIASKSLIDNNKIIIDPGIGFGKDFNQNIEVLRRLGELKNIAPILLGTSRKRFIGTLLNNVPPKERDEGTIATTVLGINSGAEIFRVHDVLKNKKAAIIADEIIRKK